MFKNRQTKPNPREKQNKGEQFGIQAALWTLNKRKTADHRASEPQGNNQ